MFIRRTFHRFLTIGSLSVILSQIVLASDLHLYLVTQKSNVGDRDQLIGISSALIRSFSAGHADQKEFNLSTESSLQIKSIIQSEISEKKDDHFLLLTVSDYGANFLLQFGSHENLKSAHFSHQLLKQHKQIAQIVDYIVLPVHAVTPEFEKTVSESKARLIKTVGVLHSLKKEDLLREAEDASQFPKSSRSYLGVILAGDAPDADGKIHFFTQVEAEKLAEWIVRRAKKQGSVVLVLNGPRTGKYDVRTQKMNFGAHQTEELDLVTAAFMRKMKRRLPHSRFKLFNFQFGRPSPYKAVLGTILKSSGEVFVPGESTSMVSETAEILPGHVWVYENGAMNSTHSAHVQSEYQSGRIHLLSVRFKEYPKLKKGACVESSLNLVIRELLNPWTKAPVENSDPK